jgi:hypothetical protein
MDNWASALQGKVSYIEFGNENGYSYKGTQNTGLQYGQAAAVAIDNLAGSGIGLLAQGDDGCTGSGWVAQTVQGLAGRRPSGWTVHPYGPQSGAGPCNGWQPRLTRTLSHLQTAGVSDPKLFITEWGISSDNGACLEDNYGFDKCLTYEAAGNLIRSNVTGIFNMW